jgi:hypothetical protein
VSEPLVHRPPTLNLQNKDIEMTDKLSPAAAISDPIAEQTVQAWHRVVTERDWDALPALVVENVTYHNPAQFEPYRGKEALVGVLRLVFSIFQDFQYLRRFDGPEGTALEFTARVGEDTLFGIDLVRFDAAGKMVDLVVMLRPADVVAKLGAEAARRMAAASDSGAA